MNDGQIVVLLVMGKTASGFGTLSVTWVVFFVGAIIDKIHSRRQQ